jgi:hypothetical protein
MRFVKTVPFVLAAGLVAAPGSLAAKQQTTTSETRAFEVVPVDGNKLVVKGQKGAQEITVPDDFRFTVAGKQVPVSELKPGMKGSATITTTTTVTPVHVTEVRNGEVMRVVGNSVIVRTPTGVRMFSEGDVAKRNIRIMKDGQPVSLSDLRERDRLTATIITEGPPKVMTERQVAATLDPGAAAAAAASRTPTAAAAEPTTGAAAATSGRRLPRTASQLPLIGLAAITSFAVALGLALRRRRVH